MTALKSYDRLECTGLWRRDNSSQRREVIVSFGEASLVLSDMQNRALAHWALAAIDTQIMQGTQALLRPGRDAEEILELADPAMLDAVQQVQKAIDKSRPRPGRLRWFLGGALVVSLTALGVFWAPKAIVSYTANVLPEVKRAQLGTAILDHITTQNSPLCQGPFGVDAARLLAERLGADGDLKLFVLQGSGDQAVVLPGDTILIYENMILNTTTPDVVAGHILAAQTRALGTDPLLTILQETGARTALSLITSDMLDKDQIAGLANATLNAPAQALNTQTMLTAFEVSGVSATPYAKHAERSLGSTAHDLARLDPYPAGTPQPLLPDGAWLGLQSICTDL